MSASSTRSLHQPERYGRLWWLPSNGEDNGLGDNAWAPIAEVDVAIVPALLAELRAAAVPAYAAPVTFRSGHRSRSWPRITSQQRYRIWAGTSAYSRAEETLRIALPALLRRGQS
jgi:hypothetical protein